MAQVHAGQIELQTNRSPEQLSIRASGSPGEDGSRLDEDRVPANAVDAMPNGGYGWVVVASCSLFSFLFQGYNGSWGVLQAALYSSDPQHMSATALPFIGALSGGLCVGLGLLSVRVQRLIGVRWAALLGVTLMGAGLLLSSATVANLGGLFVTAGFTVGLGACLLYTVSNVLPLQWFGGRLGTANGIVKAGGGVGATVLAVALQAMISRLDVAWAFRIVGIVTLATGVPAALVIKTRGTSSLPVLDVSLFRSLTFCCLFFAGAVGTFALYVPPAFLPLFAHSIGLSPATGAGILAAFNACTAVGRFGVGFACDRFGSTNMLLLGMALNAASMLALWPVSSTLAPLATFAAINGVANGAFFVAMPTAVSRLAGPGQSAVAVNMAVTAWAVGCFMGSPIAGLLISATGADRASTIGPYRAAIFYAGGVSMLSMAAVLVARLRMSGSLIKRL